MYEPSPSPGIRRSSLARNCDVSLDAGVREEACPHDLAPTTSTTAALVIGDALAVALLQEKGFTREEFARIHPGGALGRKLVDQSRRDHAARRPPDARRFGDDARGDHDDRQASRHRRRSSTARRHVDGVLTAGDLSRLVERERDIMPIPVRSVMTTKPKIAHAGELASAVAYRLEQHGLMVMPVVNDADELVGVVHLHDLLRARVL